MSGAEFKQFSISNLVPVYAGVDHSFSKWSLTNAAALNYCNIKTGADLVMILFLALLSFTSFGSLSFFVTIALSIP